MSAGFSELDVARAERVSPAPDDLLLEVAALAEVYACAGHAVHRVPITLQDIVRVVGTDPVGLALGQAARLAGV